MFEDDDSDFDYESNDDDDENVQDDVNRKKMKNKKQNTIKYESEEETLNELNVNRKESEESCLSKKSREMSLDKTNNSQEQDCDNLMENQKENVDNVDGNGDGKGNEKVDGDAVVDYDINTSKLCDGDNGTDEIDDVNNKVIVTNASVDIQNIVPDVGAKSNLDAVREEITTSVLDTLDCIDKHGLVSPARSACVSPASSNGGVYSVRFKIYDNAQRSITHHFQDISFARINLPPF